MEQAIRMCAEVYQFLRDYPETQKVCQQQSAMREAFAPDLS